MSDAPGGRTQQAAVLAPEPTAGGVLVGRPGRVARRRVVATTAFGSGCLIMLFGYALLDKGFAYIKPPGPVFFSEVLLAVGLVWGVLHVHRVTGTFSVSPQLWTVGCYMGWGLVLTAVALPTWGLDAARDAALWYYATFAVLVAAYVARSPARLEAALGAYARFLPWLVGWLSVGVFTARLNSVLVLPDGVSLLASKSGNTAIHAIVAAAFLGYFGQRYYARGPRRVLTVVAFVDALVASTQARGALAGILVAGTLLVVLYGRPRATFVAPGIALAVLAGTFFAVTGVSVQTERDREISVEQLTDNFASVLAGGTGVDDSNLIRTTEWRRELWTSVARKVRDEDATALGIGFGTNLGSDLMRFPPRTLIELRNPHNSHLDVYARMGVLGAGLWVALWATWFATVGPLAVRGMRDRGDGGAIAAICVAACAGILVNAFVDPTLEGPQVAIWAWTFHGLGVAAWLLDREGTPLVIRGRVRS